MELKTSKYGLIYKNGAIRWIKAGGVEIIRMLYSAVRDHNWRTIEPVIINEKILKTESGFQIEFSANYQKKNIDFYADYLIRVTENRLIFEMNGKAYSSFRCNRIGFCVLHPIKECAGKICTIIHPDKTLENVTFPVMVSPNQPMMNIAGLEWEPVSSIKAQLSFSGDIFEMEDQRNWTDASYKTYSRSLELSFPFKVRTDEKIRQKIILEIQGIPKKDYKKNYISFRIDKNKKFKIPEIGVCATSRNEPLDFEEAKLLKKLPINHLRAEIQLFEKSWKSILDKVIAESILLELPLFLVLYFSEKFEDEIKKVRLFFQNKKNKAKCILVVGKNHLPNDLIFDAIFIDLKSIFPEAKIGAGVNAYFAELNRNRPQSKNTEFISFTICPQVHAFDNFSLVENLEAQKYVVDSAKKLFPDKPIYLSPITLKQRFNVVATSVEPIPFPGELPSNVDIRQSTIFTAQWLLVCLKFLAQSGADVVTFFETVGWCGFIQGNYDPPLSEKFIAAKGDIFPVFHLLKEIVGFRKAIYCKSNLPLFVDGIVMQNQNKIKLILVNFSVDEKLIEVQSTINWSEFRTLTGDLKIIKNKNRIILPPEEIVISEESYVN